MASFKAPKHLFDSDELAVLDQAFEAAWAAIEPHYSSTPELEAEHRTHLRQAAHGVKDAQMLRDFALLARSPCLLLHRGDSAMDRYAGLH